VSLHIENELLFAAKSDPHFVLCDLFYSPHALWLFQGMESNGFCSSVGKLVGLCCEEI